MGAVGGRGKHVGGVYTGEYIRGEYRHRAKHVVIYTHTIEYFPRDQRKAVNYHLRSFRLFDHCIAGLVVLGVMYELIKLELLNLTGIQRPRHPQNVNR